MVIVGKAGMYAYQNDIFKCRDFCCFFVRFFQKKWGYNNYNCNAELGAYLYIGDKNSIFASGLYGEKKELKIDLSSVCELIEDEELYTFGEWVVVEKNIENSTIKTDFDIHIEALTQYGTCFNLVINFEINASSPHNLTPTLKEMALQGRNYPTPEQPPVEMNEDRFFALSNSYTFDEYFKPLDFLQCFPTTTGRGFEEFLTTFENDIAPVKEFFSNRENYKGGKWGGSGTTEKYENFIKKHGKDAIPEEVRNRGEKEQEIYKNQMGVEAWIVDEDGGILGRDIVAWLKPKNEFARISQNYKSSLALSYVGNEMAIKTPENCGELEVIEDASQVSTAFEKIYHSGKFIFFSPSSYYTKVENGFKIKDGVAMFDNGVYLIRKRKSV